MTYEVFQITEMFNLALQISPGEHGPVGDQNCATALPRGIAISGPPSSPPGSSHSMISRCGLPTRVPPHEEPDELHPTAPPAPTAAHEHGRKNEDDERRKAMTEADIKGSTAEGALMTILLRTH